MAHILMLSLSISNNIYIEFCGRHIPMYLVLVAGGTIVAAAVVGRGLLLQAAAGITYQTH